MSEIQKNKNLLNVVRLQEELDGILFDYVDTSQKWDQAYEKLDHLLNELVGYFNGYVEKNDGKFLESDMYWTLFMDIASRLIYFRTVAFMNLVEHKCLEQKEKVKKGIHDAANCLPNAQNRNLDFLQEMSQTFEQVFDNHEFERIYIKKNNTLKDCLEAFKQYCARRENKILN